MLVDFPTCTIHAPSPAAYRGVAGCWDRKWLHGSLTAYPARQCVSEMPSGISGVGKIYGGCRQAGRVHNDELTSA